MAPSGYCHHSWLLVQMRLETLSIIRKGLDPVGAELYGSGRNTSYIACEPDGRDRLCAAVFQSSIFAFFWCGEQKRP